MDAYRWVTDNVLHQIKALDGSKSPKIQKAQQIVDRIESRDLYKMIREKRVLLNETIGSLVCYYFVILYITVCQVKRASKPLNVVLLLI